MVTRPCDTVTDLACASSKLWSVMFMICCRISAMSCFLFSPPSPDVMFDEDPSGGTAYPLPTWAGMLPC